MYSFKIKSVVFHVRPILLSLKRLDLKILIYVDKKDSLYLSVTSGSLVIIKRSR